MRTGLLVLISLILVLVAVDGRPQKPHHPRQDPRLDPALSPSLQTGHSSSLSEVHNDSLDVVNVPKKRTRRGLVRR
uniref:Uncharacterized protein n=1 Tax=Pristionchus pacificus TaxID=54126 RepID=A0A2A6CR40_PRIPA|eukprot:PDM80527.1 hypothetical protein PRIPAC_35430 [Pristionchus pacificus]